MSRSWHLGNDIVDLADRRHAGKAGDLRFLQRVFTPEEQRTIRATSDPDRTLWVLWAAKEAAFKTVSKLLGTPPVFNHPLFQVTVSGVGAERSNCRPPDGTTPGRTYLTRHEGAVRYGAVELPVRIEANGSSLHALSWAPNPQGETPRYSWGWEMLAEEQEEDWRALYGPRLSSVEWECISHRASALARLAAKRALASALGAAETDLVISCEPGPPGRRIPRAFLSGKPLEGDLSLSHHGQLLAWAFVVD